MACFDPSQYIQDDNGNWVINWAEFPYCDTAQLTTACLDEQSVHWDLARAKLWGEPTPSRSFLRADIDPQMTHTSSAPTLVNTGQGSVAYGSTFSLALPNPSNCLPAMAIINYCYPHVRSRFAHNRGNGISVFNMDYSVAVNGIIERQTFFHTHQYNSDEGGTGDYQQIGTPGGSFVTISRIVPGGTATLTIDKRYRLQDGFDDTGAGSLVDGTESLVVINGDDVQVDIITVKDS